ncbi:Type cbb3 cytochrome oxidase biogenesis protein CcoG, involved in Cu oxidation [hydrothermal vent metagenome]|uniref:Type cbb3 cytochrome oxidase biogenesis protein CcoG, involved in Cu oxidation n=1 Tax=hydrothermal vent metagenome TaxID=652676 RepID=A0A3B0XBM3_9ZZZZ
MESLLNQKTVNIAGSDEKSIAELYEEADHWHVNTGEEVIHAKRMGGKFRKLKWKTMSVWLIFFFGPWLRWDGSQAILFNIPERQFKIFEILIMPQDVWLLALVLLFFAILLAAATSIAGRVFCGYFCFQTVWTDIFTLIEEKLEGPPTRRRKLDAAPWDAHKIRIKIIKHSLWLSIGLFTGFSFTAWFTDAYQLITDTFSFNAHITVYIILVTFSIGTYILAGFMREQTCFWLCPYARIQGVMYDTQTILPTYDIARGEPRGKLSRGQPVEGNGDCISCNQCVAVCPTGIDIRGGQQEGCITCGLCLDACDSVMDKIGLPRGLIRYDSMDNIKGGKPRPLHKRPRVLIYTGIILFAMTGILYGLTHLGTYDLKVIHERQPLFVQMSSGDIQNRYELKILNKTDHEMHISIVVSGIENIKTQGIREKMTLPPNRLTSFTVFLKIPKKNLKKPRTPIYFTIESFQQFEDSIEYRSTFYGPRI